MYVSNVFVLGGILQQSAKDFSANTATLWHSQFFATICDSVVQRPVCSSLESPAMASRVPSAAETMSAAAAEGLELVPSTNATGFKGVFENGGKYATKVREDGKLRHLGSSATPEEAALQYSRHIGAARTAAEAAEARGDGLQPSLTAAEVMAASTAEGLELVPSSNAAGFKGVSKQGSKYRAEVWEDGNLRYLGYFHTRGGAALCYARHIGAARAAAEAAEARGDGLQPLTAAEAKAAAAADGLELVPCSNATGFRGVMTKDNGKYQARVSEGGKKRSLGTFNTPEEASLAIARYFGKSVDRLPVSGPRPTRRVRSRDRSIAPLQTEDVQTVVIGDFDRFSLLRLLTEVASQQH